MYDCSSVTNSRSGRGLRWIEASAELVKGFASHSSCRPEQRGLLTAAAVILTVAVVLLIPFAFCVGAGLAALASSAGARAWAGRAAGRLAEAVAPTPLRVAGAQARARLQGYTRIH